MKGYISKIYLELLDDERKKVFQKLFQFKDIGYLAGGTALALQIKHRKSFDFDVFIHTSVSHVLRKKIERILGKYPYYVNTNDQISFNTEKQIGITFVRYYYNPQFPLIRTSSISLASVLDIAADKAHTIGRRAQWRDYVDLYTLIKRGITNLDEVIMNAEKKFKGEFVKTQFLEQLVYYKDITVTPIEYMDEQPSFQSVQSYLEKSVREYLKKVL